MKTYLKGLVLALVCFSAPVLAEPKVVDDWLWTSKKNYNYSLTINSKGDTFGQYCYFNTGNCVFAFRNKVTCKDTHDYPALVSSDNGTQHLTLTCVAANKKASSLYAVSPFEDLEKIINSSTKIAFVVGLADGVFKVSRFSLKGSKKAILEMQDDTESKMVSDGDLDEEELPDGQYL